MKILKIALFVLLLTSLENCSGQTCPSDSIFRVDSLRDGNEKYLLRLTFLIRQDSILAFKKIEYPILSFKIIEKSCKWNEALTEGVTTYRLSNKNESGEEYFSFKMVFTKTDRYFELHHDNSVGSRLFMIQKSQ